MIKYLIKHKYILLLSLIIISYILYFSFLSIRRMYTLQSHYYDLGIMNQVVYNTLHGRFLEMTNQDLMKNASRFAVHFDPILAFLAPFYLLYSGAETLLIIKTICVGLGGLAVYLIAAHYFKKNQLLPLFFTASYFLFFPVQRQNLFDVHGVVFGTTFLLFLIYFTLKKKFRFALLFLILSLLTKEHVGAVTFLFGLYIFFFQKQRKFGIAVCIISILFFIAAFAYIIPQSRQLTHFAARYYGDFGDSPKTIMVGIVKSPIKTFLYFLKPITLNYLLKLTIPFGIFAIFSPLQALIAIPEITINILSINPNMREIYFHYNALIIPFLIWSAIVGYQNMVNSKLVKRYSSVALILFIITFAWSIYMFDPLTLSFVKESYSWGHIYATRIEELKNWNRRLGDAVKVSSTPLLAPFLSGRQYFYNFLFDPSYANMGHKESDIINSLDIYAKADYVILDKDEVGVTKGELLKIFYRHLKSNKQFQLIWIDRNSQLEVYKKVQNSNVK